MNELCRMKRANAWEPSVQTEVGGRACRRIGRWAGGRIGGLKDTIALKQIVCFCVIYCSGRSWK